MRDGVKPAIHEARRAKGFEKPTGLADNLLSGDLADRNHLITMIRVGNNVTVLTKHIEYRYVSAEKVPIRPGALSSLRERSDRSV